MNLLFIVLLAQLAAAAARQTSPVLAFPEPGLDDSAAYQGYQTRFYRDAAGNTVQIYLDGRTGRVVQLWADADNESIGFTVRDAAGRVAPLHWDEPAATIFGSRSGMRSLEYGLVADVPRVQLGLFLLGSMRVERDFQYAGRHRGPLDAPRFSLPEVDRLLSALGRLAPVERQRHLALLGATTVSVLQARLQPTITTRQVGSSWVTRVVQPSLDARDTLVLEVRVDPRLVEAARAGDSISLRARSGTRVPFTVRIATTAKSLTPLTRGEIFTTEFLDFVATAQRRAADASAADSVRLRARWLERQVRGVELLSSREKLMAGLPNYATYFGRDMMVAALMMRPIWRPAMSELVIASVLHRLSPSGQVSHEEALGGQAIREAAAEYAALVERAVGGGQRAAPNRAADSLLASARAVLRDARRIRENYHMIDDEFQLPVLTARWLGDQSVPAARKRAFLLEATDDGEPRLVRLLRELALISRMTAAYAASPTATNLVSFPARDSGWSSASWRDSNAGYAGGRFAMDVNAIWVPNALESIARILDVVRTLGFSVDSIARVNPDLIGDAPLASYARDTSTLRRAIDTWWSASRHFVVRYGPADVASRVAARLAALPAEERDYWTRVLATSSSDSDSLAFLAIALDAGGRPIGVANTDPATGLFLRGGSSPADVLRDVRLFVRAYPVGLFIGRVGPVVANDAYAAPNVWQAFERDRYHGPRVVWGREVNLFLAGVANQIAGARGTALEPYVPELRSAMQTIMSAVQASGFRSELWSYEIKNGRVTAVRYGVSSDVQLWSTTDLAVQYALSKLGR